MNLRIPHCLNMLVLAAAVSANAAVEKVSVSAGSFNPTLGQTVTLIFHSSAAGTATALVLDRDGYLVTTLTDKKPVVAGRNEIAWDGRDAHGRLVADEAYSFKIDLSSSQSGESYFPAAEEPRVISVSADRYDRRTGMLAYVLPVPARVHIQAGSAAQNPKTNSYEGPVLKTLVDREPRPAGAVLESWNGLDESGLLYVPDQPDFVTAILATTLPGNSVIAFGNKRRRFVDEAGKRSGNSLIPQKPHDHRQQTHHHGLTVLEDLSPALFITPANASFDEHRKGWNVGRKDTRLKLKLVGPSAVAVSKDPGRIVVFVDRRAVAEVDAARGSEIKIPVKHLRGQTHLVTVNWQSKRGPLAVNSIRLFLPHSLKMRGGGHSQ